MSLFDKYTKKEIEQILSISNSYKDFAKKIGYSNTPSGDTLKNLKEKLKDYDISHFYKKEKVIRNENNVFIENSTASQNTLRTWYIKGKYSSYVCSICGQEPFWKGKELTLILDHINGINNDDRLENLRWVCPNCNQQLSTTGSKNPNRKNIAKKYYCLDCGKEISKGSKRCVSCSAKNKIIKEEDMLLSREELKDLIRNKPFTQIGKQFNVSDNAIRKWCDKYNLPRKKSEIVEMSDEEWKKI